MQATGLVPSVNYNQSLGAINSGDSGGVGGTYQSGESDSKETYSSGTNGKLGSIFAKYEAGGWNPGSVSSGKGDYGGVSYGIPQFSSKTGSAASFVKWLGGQNAEMGSYFNGLTPGSTEFNNAWKTVSQKYGDNFGNMQMQYSYNNYALPLAKLAKEKTGVDYTSNPALMELIYSTAVQFGNGSLGLKALGNVKSGMSVTDIINASYDNKIANYKSYFKSSSSAVQESVKNRFINERRDVLALAGGGTGTNTNVKANTNSGGLVNTAKQYLGTPYVWGGSSTKGFDCSGFTQYVFKQNGITINRTARDQYKNGVAVDKSQLQPGDLVFFKGSSGSSSAPGHVGLYIGNGQFIHSPKTGDVVKVSGLDGRKDYVGARRIAG